MLTTNSQVREGKDHCFPGISRWGHVAGNTALVTQVKHPLDLQFLVASDFDASMPHGPDESAGRSSVDGKGIRRSRASRY
jgi:hypothetical protein